MQIALMLLAAAAIAVFLFFITFRFIFIRLIRIFIFDYFRGIADNILASSLLGILAAYFIYFIFIDISFHARAFYVAIDG